MSSPRFMPREASRYRQPRIVVVSWLRWMSLNCVWNASPNSVPCICLTLSASDIDATVC